MLSVYPFEKTRPGTEEALTAIQEAFSRGKRFVIVSAPTGSGKSGIGVAFARKYGAIICTPTKILQNQYSSTEEFTFEYPIFGKSNYFCGIPAFKSATVDASICCSDELASASSSKTPFSAALSSAKGKGAAKRLKVLCSEHMICPYYSKIDRIKKNPGAIINYDLFFNIKSMPSLQRLHRERDLGTSLVFDEAHQLIEKISSHFGHELTNTQAIRVLGGEAARSKGEPVKDWLHRQINMAVTLLQVEDEDAKVISRLNSFMRKLQFLVDVDVFDDIKFHIDDQGDVVNIRPLDFRMLKQLVFDPFDKILMMTATLPANFTEILGITPEEVEIVTIPSTFPKENRPVIFPTDIENVNYKTQFAEDSEQIILLNKIMTLHSNDKGLIHCANYKMLSQLKSIFYRNPRFLWVERDMDKDKILELHSSSPKPTILVSPSMMEGVDLKDDFARFQVMMKVPYPALDEYTKRMDEIFPTWYQNKVVTSIVQAYGRAVRSETDHARFYILDGSFGMLVSRYKKIIPSYFTEALKLAPKAKLHDALDRKIAEQRL